VFKKSRFDTLRDERQGPWCDLGKYLPLSDTCSISPRLNCVCVCIYIYMCVCIYIYRLTKILLIFVSFFLSYVRVEVEPAFQKIFSKMLAHGELSFNIFSMYKIDK